MTFWSGVTVLQESKGSHKKRWNDNELRTEKSLDNIKRLVSVYSTKKLHVDQIIYFYKFLKEKKIAIIFLLIQISSSYRDSEGL